MRDHWILFAIFSGFLGCVALLSGLKYTDIIGSIGILVCLVMLVIYFLKIPKWNIVKKYIKKAEVFCLEKSETQDGAFDHFMYVFSNGIGTVMREHLAKEVLDSLVLIFQTSFNPAYGNLMGIDGHRLAFKRASSYLNSEIFKRLKNAWLKENCDVNNLKDYENFEKEKALEPENLSEGEKLGRKLF